MAVLTGRAATYAQLESTDEVSPEALAPVLMKMAEDLSSSFGASELEAFMGVWQFDDLRKVRNALTMMYSLNLVPMPDVTGQKMNRVFFNANLTTNEGLNFDKVGVKDARTSYTEKSRDSRLSNSLS